MPAGTRPNVTPLDLHAHDEAVARTSGDWIAERRSAMLRQHVPANEVLPVPPGYAILACEEYSIELDAELQIEDGAFIEVRL